MLLEAGISNKIPTKAEQAAVGTLCIGVTMATVTDPTISANLFGLAVGCAAVFFTAIYQVPHLPCRLAACCLQEPT